MIPWHRLKEGRGAPRPYWLTDLYHGTSYRVDLEKDLSLKRQLLDTAIIAIEADEGTFVDLEEPPDGLEDLSRHNLLTFKSLHEPLNDFAMDELLGHFVNYRKQVSPIDGPLVAVSEFRLIAVTARFPEQLASQVVFTKRGEGVYNVIWGMREIRVVVLGRVSDEQRNALWALFSGNPDRVAAGSTQYRWKRPDLSRILGKLYENYRLEGFKMSYTVEDFKRDLYREALESMPVEEIRARVPLEQLLRGLPPKELADRLSPEERLRGLPPEEVLSRFPPEKRLEGLSREQIEAYLKGAE